MTNTPNTPQESAPDRSADEQLGDAGRKALEAERQARREAERRAHEAQQRLAELEEAERRRRVASEKGLTDAQARFLGDGTEEEMAARADELLAAFVPADDRVAVRRRPREQLKPGAAPMAEPQDLGAVADRIMRGW